MFKKGKENYSAIHGSWNKGLKGEEYKSHYKNGFGGLFEKGTKINIGRKHNIETRTKQRNKKLKDGFSISPQGYRIISYYGKHILEHQLNWCKANNMCFIPAGTEIHHVDRNKINKHPENLLLLDHKTHMQLHQQIKEAK